MPGGDPEFVQPALGGSTEGGGPSYENGEMLVKGAGCSAWYTRCVYGKIPPSQTSSRDGCPALGLTYKKFDMVISTVLPAGR